MTAAIGLLLYAVGIRRARRRGARWPGLRTTAFVLLGVGSYAAVTCGFLGALSPVIRWAFVVRLALLLLLVPGLVVLGRPADLVRAAGSDRTRRRVDAVLGSRPGRVLGSPIITPLVPLGLFLALLTPAAGWLRTTSGGSATVDLVVPLIGLLIAIPLSEPIAHPSSTAIVAEFMLGFVELVVDAIPGIVMRLSTVVLDGVPHLAASAPLWAPHPLRDQQLAGDLLWLIAEAGDLPALILLFIRWNRTDRHDARSIDSVSDEDYAALAHAHLHPRHD